jgi:hypothetical protein
MKGRYAYRDSVGKPIGKKPLSFLFHGYQGVSLGVKQLEHETDHSPPPSAEVRNKHNYTFSPPYKVILEELLFIIGSRNSLDLCTPKVY